MADELNVQDTEDTSLKTEIMDAEQILKGTVQDQDVSQTLEKVDKSEENASSVSEHKRSKGSWATERIVERAVKRQLSEALTPILEKLDNLSNFKSDIPYDTGKKSDDIGEPDLNNLSAWIKETIKRHTDRELSDKVQNKINELTVNINRDNRTREARNYLLSQEDIGNDEDKLAEIEQIMKDNLLDYAAIHQPLSAVKKAINLWRRNRINPNAPKKQELSTISGGMSGNIGKKELSIEQLQNLQKILSSDLPESEKEKIYPLIDNLLKV